MANGMSEQEECDLGEIICDRTPYESMEMPPNWQTLIEWDQQPLTWSFQGIPRRVAKALRIPVIIKDTKGHKYLDWLLIGYEGHGP